MQLVTDHMDTNKDGYIYIVQEPEFIHSNVSVFKIGRTSQSNHKRFSGYPVGTKIMYQEYVNNTKDLERVLIRIFKQEFLQYAKGNEYFYGNIYKMMDVVKRVCQREQQLNHATNDDWINANGGSIRMKPMKPMKPSAYHVQKRKGHGKVTSTPKLTQKKKNRVQSNDPLEFTCIVCGYQTIYKHVFTKHVNRKRQCKEK